MNSYVNGAGLRRGKVFFVCGDGTRPLHHSTASEHNGGTFNRLNREPGQLAWQCGTTLVTYESCIVQVSHVTCDHVRSHMIDVATEITHIKKHFLIINIVELDLHMILLTI